MTRIKPYRSATGRLLGFSVVGHAHYGAPGYDIVCAALSALTTCAVNGLQMAAGKPVDLEEADGLVQYRIRGRPNIRTDTLLETVAAAYQGIAEAYPLYVSYEEDA